MGRLRQQGFFSAGTQKAEYGAGAQFRWGGPGGRGGGTLPGAHPRFTAGKGGFFLSGPFGALQRVGFSQKKRGFGTLRARTQKQPFPRGGGPQIGGQGAPATPYGGGEVEKKKRSKGRGEKKKTAGEQLGGFPGGGGTTGGFLAGVGGRFLQLLGGRPRGVKKNRNGRQKPKPGADAGSRVGGEGAGEGGVFGDGGASGGGGGRGLRKGGGGGGGPSQRKKKKKKKRGGGGGGFFLFFCFWFFFFAPARHVFCGFLVFSHFQFWAGAAPPGPGMRFLAPKKLSAAISKKKRQTSMWNFFVF